MNKIFGKRNRCRSRAVWGNKGSSTVEYVIIIAVGALLAGLLFLAMSDGEGFIQSVMEKKVRESIEGRLSGGDLPSGTSLGISGSPDASGSFPPDLLPSGGNGSSTSGSGGNGESGGNQSPAPPRTGNEKKSGFTGWLEKAKNYVVSGQILKDAAHIGKETVDFLILDDVSGCFTGKDTDGNKVTGWERGLSCVSLIPAAKVAKVGKYADEAIAFVRKLDDKLAATRLGDKLKTAKKKLDNLFGRGKRVACGCNDSLTPKATPKGRGYRTDGGAIIAEKRIVKVNPVPKYRKATGNLSLDYVAKVRRELGIPPIGEDKKLKDAGILKSEQTVAVLEADGVQIWGRNGWGVDVGGYEELRKEWLKSGGKRNPSVTNSQTYSHAEGDVFWHLYKHRKKNRILGGSATMVVDRPLCKPCASNSGVRSLVEEVGLDELIVITPDNKQGIKITPRPDRKRKSW
jgi:hypothetical protein